MGQRTTNALLIVYLVWYDEVAYDPAKAIQETLRGLFYERNDMASPPRSIAALLTDGF